MTTPRTSAAIAAGQALIVALVLEFGVHGVAMAAAQPRTAEIWLAPFSPDTAPGDPREGAPDYFDLFKPGADWAVVAGRTRVFKIYRDQLLAMPDTALQTIFKGLEQRHIALGMESNVLMDTSVCTPGVDKAKPILPEIERIKRLGGDLRYLAMNEPLAGGMAGAEPGACHASIAAIAADVARNLKPLLGVFPALQIGDVEPIGRTADLPDWPADLARWLAAYESAMGRKLAFIHADTVWGRAWEDDLRALSTLAHHDGIPFGVIYTGDLSELSDAAWAHDVGHYAAQAEAVLGGPPDQAMFQSWIRWPQHTLPDSNPDTFTGLVRDYLRPQSQLVTAGPGRVRLIGSYGEAIAHAPLQVRVHGPGPAEPVVQQTMAGEVPAGATSALFALRVNTECHCPPAAIAMTLGPLHYSDGQNHASFDSGQWAAQRPDLLRRGADGLAILLSPDQPLLLNGPPFPVKAGSQFTAEFAWGVSSLARQPGYLAIVFRGPDGIEMRRPQLRIGTTWQTVAAVATDGAGVAAFGPVTTPHVVDEISYGGDDSHRPTTLLLPAP